jgi:hypothetical protein
MGFASSEAALERFGRVRSSALITMFSCVLLMAGVPREAKADGFIGYYAPSSFTLANMGGFLPNGSASFPDSATLILTGTNDGSGLPGNTNLTVAARAPGLFQFSYVFTTLDEPGFEYGGFLLSGAFFQLADTDGESGSVIVPVSLGETIGFSVGSGDDTGGAGVLTVTDFAAPVPEPGAMQLLLAGAAAAIILRSRRIRFLLRTRRLASVAPVVAAAVCSMPALLAQSQVFYSPSNVTGQLSLVNVVNVSQQAKASEQPVDLMAMIERAETEGIRTPRSGLGLRSARTRMLAKLAARPLASTGTPPMGSLSIVPPAGVTGFNALSHLDQRNANNGNQFSVEPPNPSIAAGNGYVLEGVNNAIQIFSTSGTPALPKVLSSNQLFGLAPALNRTTGVNGVFPTDMRVFFDSGINRWFVIQRSQDNDAFGDELNSSHLYIAVSQSGDPTANYNIYLMNTTNPNHPGCPCIDDYPQIGADQYGFHIAWNEFNAPSLEFVDAAILTISKASLTSGASSPAAVQFLIPFITGFEFAIQPATTPPGAANFLASGGVEYFTSTSHSFGFGGEVALWAMYNTSSLGTLSSGGALGMTLTQVGVACLAYQPPDVAIQRPGPTPLGTSLGAPLEFLDGGDSRVQSLSYAGGSLYMTLQTGINDQNGNWVVGGAYIVLSPTFRSSVLAAKVVNQGYLLVNNNHLLRPEIAVNAQGAGAIAVTLVGVNWYPSAALIPFASSASTPTTIQVAATGALPEDGFTGYVAEGGDGVARWGDYNAAIAASDGSIWMAVQYIGNYPRTSAANWNTFLMHVQP